MAFAPSLPQTRFAREVQNHCDDATTGQKSHDIPKHAVIAQHDFVLGILVTRVKNFEPD